MRQNHTDDERDNEIVPFIGIPRKWTNPALKIYAIIFLAYGTWMGFQELGNAAQPLLTRFSAFYTHLAAASVVEALLFVSLIQLGDIVMYLTNRFKTDVEKVRAEGIEQGKAEGIEQGKAEGIEQGIATAYQQWQAWNTRRIDAEAKGLPFDEPPPEPPEILKNGTPTTDT